MSSSKFDSLNTPIVYINLDETASRRVRMEEQTTGVKNIRRFPAVNAKKLASVDNPNHVQFMSTISLLTQARIYLKKRCAEQEIDRYGAIGCSLSHCFLWLFFAGLNNKENYKYFTSPENYEYVSNLFTTLPQSDYLIVFEDDVKLQSNFLSMIQSNVDKYNLEYGDDWDVFLLGYNGLDVENPNDFRKGFSEILFSPYKRINKCNDPEFCDVKAFFGTWAYIIKRKAIPNIMNENFFPIEQHIDSYLGMLSQKDIIKIVGAKKHQIEVYNEFPSEIGHGSPRINYINVKYNIRNYKGMWCMILILMILLGYFIYYNYGKNNIVKR